MAQALRVPPEFEVLSKISETGQTTVPVAVRKALGVQEGDHIAYTVGGSGVSLRRADETRADPAIGSFLAFLANDIAKSPQNLQAFPPELANRISALVKDMNVDIDAPIEGDVEL